MQKRDWLLILLIYLACLEVLSWTPVRDLSLCLIEVPHQSQPTNHDNPKYCPAFHVGVAVFAEETNSFLETHDKSVIGGFTIVLAISTIGLWLATNRLWIAGERQMELIGRNAEQQARDTSQSLAIASTSAGAAVRSAEIAERALHSTERAFVFLKYAYASPFFSTSQGVVVGWDFHIVWENAGSTPTQNMFTYNNLLVMPKEQTPATINFPDLISGAGEKQTRRTFVGPKSFKDAGAQSVPVDVLNTVRDGQGRLFLWGWTEYSHIFRPDDRARSEYCFEVTINGDLTLPPNDGIKPPFEFVSFDTHNGSAQECYRQPGDIIPILRL